MKKEELQQLYTIMLKRNGMITQESRWGNVIEIKVEWPDPKSNRWYRSFFKLEPKMRFWEDPQRK
jgi:hypothetical protein